MITMQKFDLAKNDAKISNFSESELNILKRM